MAEQNSICMTGCKHVMTDDSTQQIVFIVHFNL